MGPGRWPSAAKWLERSRATAKERREMRLDESWSAAECFEIARCIANATAEQCFLRRPHAEGEDEHHDPEDEGVDAEDRHEYDGRRARQRERDHPESDRGEAA